jgi:hypothetical protein
MAKRKLLPTTWQEWWPIRWGTKHEDDDASALICGYLSEGHHDGHLSEDFARALEKSGWMIVVRPEFDDGQKWPMDPDYGPVPAWADDGSDTDPNEIWGLRREPKEPPTLQIIDGGKKDETTD